MHDPEDKSHPPAEPPHPTRRELIEHAVLLGILGAGTAENAAAAPAPPREHVNVSFTLNGSKTTVDTEARVTLLDALRERMDLPGTKKGCDHGQCGACTVLVDGRRVLSCLTLLATLRGKQVTTIEGLAHDGQLHPVQTAFLDHDGFQCGFCTPGQIMSAVGFLGEKWPATKDAIREGMSGNLCRCGAYQGIVEAVEQARREQGGGRS